MIPLELISCLRTKFEDAVNSGDLIFTPSTVSEHSDSGVQVRPLLLRFSKQSIHQAEVAPARHLVPNFPLSSIREETPTTKPDRKEIG